MRQEHDCVDDSLPDRIGLHNCLRKGDEADSAAVCIELCRIGFGGARRPVPAGLDAG